MSTGHSSSRRSISAIISCYEIGITCSEIVFARSDLLAAFTGEIGMLDCITGCVTEKFTPGIEALFLPRCIDIIEERLGKSNIDLHRLRGAIVSRRVGMRHDILILYYDIAKSVQSLHPRWTAVVHGRCSVHPFVSISESRSRWAHDHVAGCAVPVVSSVDSPSLLANCCDDSTTRLCSW